MVLRRYQGAYTGVIERGLFVAEPENDVWIWHVDVKSMYPVVMIMLNLSSENVTLVSKKRFSGRYRYDAASGIIEVPDSYLGQITVKVGRETSVTRKFMLEFLAMRERLRLHKQTASLRSKQLAIKLIMNATYGYHGLEHSRYGNFLVAVVTAATGRFIIDTILAVVDSLDNVKALEYDTDGVYTVGVDCSKFVNDKLHEIFADYAPFVDKLRVDTNKYAGIIVYRAKNYVLLTVDGMLKFKGSAFKGRHMPNICRVALERFARAAFNRESFRMVWSEFKDLRKFPLSDFTMSVTLRKDPHGQVERYGYDEHTMYKQLADKLGDDVVWGEDVYYVKTVRGYIPLGCLSDSEMLRLIDRKYYLERIRDVVKRLQDAVYDVRTVKVGRKRYISGRTKLERWLK